MLNEEIKKKLEEFYKQKTRSKSWDELCKENGIRKYKSRSKTIWGKRTYENKDTHWDNLNLDEYSPDKPVIVCLSGNGTRSTKGANGMCRIAENMLELMFKMKDSEIKAEDKVDIVSCSYNVDLKYLFFPNDEKVKEEYPNVNEFAKEFPEAIKEAPSKRGYLTDANSEQFAKNILLSKCLNKNGEKLPIDECQRNISQVIFFTYCYGASALEQIIDCFTDMLSRKGFDKEEIDEITSSLSHVSFAMLTYTKRIPSTYFFAVNDYNLKILEPLLEVMNESGSQLETRLSQKRELTFGEDLLRISLGEDNAGSLEFAYMGIEKDDEEVVVGQDQEHYLINMDRNEEWDIINRKKGIYNAISQMMSWALCRAVENGLDNAHSDKYIPKILMEQLQDELLDIYHSFSNEELTARQQE